MSWWSWAILGYAGLIVLLLFAFASVSGLIEVRSRLLGRRLVDDAERFLADAALAVDSPTGLR